MNSNDAATERRKQLAAMLLRGEKVSVAPSGAIQPLNERTSRDVAITIPEGKLALYWYEEDRELYRDEVNGMTKFFPQFKPEFLSDNRLSWVGSVASDIPGSERIWLLQAVYDHDHPHNDGYGGSIKVFSIEPDLEEIEDLIGVSIPHTMLVGDSVAICTVEAKAFAASTDINNYYVDSAASSIARAVKWIAAFELWMLGEISTEDFDDHQI